MCNGLTAEDYCLVALGLSEKAEAELIQIHLRDHCPVCLEAVQEAFRFWAVFGAAHGLGSGAAPSPGVRDRFLESIGSGARPAAKVIPWWRSRAAYAGAIAAGVILAATLGWRFSASRAPRPESAVRVEAPPSAALEQQVAELRSKLREAEREVGALAEAGSKNIVPVRLNQATAVDCSLEVDRALSEANQQIQQLRTTISGEQAKSARLAQEFDQQAAAVATISRERRDAEANLAAANGRLAERDRQIKALDAKITQLERERDRLNDLRLNNKNRLDQATRLVALLSAPSAKLVRLAGTQAAPGATGYALMAEGQKLIFSSSNLPGLKPGRSYQLWLMRGRTPGIVSAGVFAGDQPTLEFTNPALLQDVRGLAVTEEPGGGSPLPTGHKVLIGTSRS
jgi:hypothetical protein